MTSWLASHSPCPHSRCPTRESAALMLLFADWSAAAAQAVQASTGCSVFHRCLRVARLLRSLGLPCVILDSARGLLALDTARGAPELGRWQLMGHVQLLSQQPAGGQSATLAGSAAGEPVACTHTQQVTRWQHLLRLQLETPQAYGQQTGLQPPGVPPARWAQGPA